MKVFCPVVRMKELIVSIIGIKAVDEIQASKESMGHYIYKKNAVDSFFFNTSICFHSTIYYHRRQNVRNIKNTAANKNCP